MTALLLVVGAYVTVLVASEVVLGGTKLQTGLARVLATWAAVFVPAAYLLHRHAGVGPLAFAILWGGSFLSWFGVRSHVESSILLRMLHLLRAQPMTAAHLLEAYTRFQGEDARRDELLKGGLAAREGERLFVTPKGMTILGVVERLR